MGRPSISQQRRIEIGRALQMCMIENGSYESTSVKDIAQKAGLATGLIHHYFNSKDEILLLMADTALIEMSNELDELIHIRDKDELIEQIHEILADQDRNKFILMLYTLSLSMPEISEMIVRCRSEQQEAVAARLRRKGTEDAEEKASEVVLIFESAVMQSPLGGGEAFEAILVRSIERIFASKK